MFKHLVSAFVSDLIKIIKLKTLEIEEFNSECTIADNSK